MGKRDAAAKAIEQPKEPSYTDGWVSRETVQAIVGQPKKAQTSLLRFLVRVGPLDGLTGDGLIGAALDYAGTELGREGGGKALKNAASQVRPGGGDIDIEMLRTIAEAPSDFHAPLLKVLLHARPLGGMSRDAFVVDIWDRVKNHNWRTMGVKNVEKLADTLALGPAFDDLVLRVLSETRNDRFEILARDVEGRMKQRAA